MSTERVVTGAGRGINTLAREIEAEFGGAAGAVQALKAALATLPPRQAQLLREFVALAVRRGYARPAAGLKPVVTAMDIHAEVERALENVRPIALQDAAARSTKASRIAGEALDRVERIERHLGLEPD